MTSDFDAWVTSLRLGEPDVDGHIGTPVPGTTEFLREMFDAVVGPMSAAALAEAWQQRELALTQHAVTLIRAGLRHTTRLDPDIDVRILDDDVTAVTYNGSYQTPALFAIHDPEATCDVANNLRDHIVEDLWSPWPTCATHRSALDPRAVDDEAVWFCGTGEHTVSAIGALPEKS